MLETTELMGTFGTLGYGGVFGISLLSNIVIPVPEEAVLLMLGYAGREHGANFPLVISLVVAGLLISDLIMYGLARQGNRYIMMFYQKFFSKRLDTRRAWFEKNIQSVIFFSRFLLQLRFLGPFMAGQCRVPLRTFLTYELAALFIYVPLVIGSGWYFHHGIENIIAGIHIVRNIILIALILAALYYLYRKVNKKIYTKSAASPM